MNIDNKNNINSNNNVVADSVILFNNFFVLSSSKLKCDVKHLEV